MRLARREARGRQEEVLYLLGRGCSLLLCLRADTRQNLESSWVAGIMNITLPWPLTCGAATASPEQQLFKGFRMVMLRSLEQGDDWIRENLWVGDFWVVVVIYKVNV